MSETEAGMALLLLAVAMVCGGAALGLYHEAVAVGAIVYAAAVNEAVYVSQEVLS